MPFRIDIVKKICGTAVAVIPVITILIYLNNNVSVIWLSYSLQSSVAVFSNNMAKISPQFIIHFADEYISSQYNMLPKENCSYTQIIYLIPVQPTEIKLRHRIRRGWISECNNDEEKAVFVIGMPLCENTSRLSLSLQNEAAKYDDIMIVDMEDSYEKLPLKTAAGLRYAVQMCPSAQWVVKVDADVVLSPANLRRFLEAQTPALPVLFGHLFPHYRVHRTGKHAVSRGTWRGEFFPPFLSGTAYVLSRSAAAAVLGATSGVRYTHNEDVLFTGLAPQLRGIPRIDAAGFHVNGSRNLQSLSPCQLRNLISFHGGTSHYSQYAQLWTQYQRLRRTIALC